MAADETWLGRGWLMPDERANAEQGPVGTPIETDQQTNKRAAEVAPSAAQGPAADARNVPLSAKPTDAASIEAATSAVRRDRKSAVWGKRGDHGGGRIINII